MPDGMLEIPFAWTVGHCMGRGPFIEWAASLCMDRGPFAWAVGRCMGRWSFRAPFHTSIANTTPVITIAPAVVATPAKMYFFYKKNLI